MRFAVRCTKLVVILLSTGAMYCLKDSPASYGLDLRAAPGFDSSRAGTSFHPVLGYSFAVGGGVAGESDQHLHIGMQLRRAAGANESFPEGFWYGGEATFDRRFTSFDPIGTITLPSETTNGFTVAGIAGFPVSEGDWGTAHAYGVVGIHKYGGWGPYSRIGIDIQPAFLRR